MHPHWGASGKELDVNSFVTRARKRAPSRHPVRDAVKDCLPDIRIARESGLSWATIFGQLKRDGKMVGKGPSSLINAFQTLERSAATLHVRPVAEAASTATIASEAPNSSVSEMGDTRFKSDWN